MAIKHLVTRGFYTSPGSIKFAVTFGYISAAAAAVIRIMRNDWHRSATL